MTVRHVLRAVGADVGQPHPRRLREIELHRADGLVASRHGRELDVDLRSVEGGFARTVDVVDAEVLQHFRENPLRLGPRLRIVDVLFLALRIAEVGSRQAHRVAVESEDRVRLGIHRQHRFELVLHLRGRAVDVRVVHAHAAHAHESADRAGILAAIHLAVFRQPQRQVAIAARRRRIHLVMMRTVHRSQRIRLAHLASVLVASLISMSGYMWSA